MERPRLHVQNVFDVLNHHGVGVNGFLKMRAIQVQNRVAALASPGDIITVSDDCPAAFTDYMQRVTGVTDVLTLRYKVSRDYRKYINARAMFESLSQDPQWGDALRRDPILRPYMQSSHVYRNARKYGIKVSRDMWNMVVTKRLVERMNDKAVLHDECKRLGLPIPDYWITGSRGFVPRITSLLKSGHTALYVRQATSAGSLGNITVEKNGSKYAVHELVDHTMNASEFNRVLSHYAGDHAESDFVITVLLDLHASPGTLYFADDNGVSVICHSEQILTRERKYIGFVYPIEDVMVKKHFETIVNAVYQVVEPWRQQGFRGYGNIDWMVTTSGELYIAERNARQTGIIPALKIENELSQPGSILPSVIPPKRVILTSDRIYFDRRVHFSDIYDILKQAGLLWEQRTGGDGIVITIPPSPAFGINSTGIMAAGGTMAETYELFNRAINLLGREESELLFKLKM